LFIRAVRFFWEEHSVYFQSKKRPPLQESDFFIQLDWLAHELGEWLELPISLDE
jgi:hypothetical protein